jgi:hypothetical protein
MNLDSNHAYGNRFVKVGTKGINPALVTSFERYTEYDQLNVAVYFGSEGNSVLFKNGEAEFVWEYLTANSDDLIAQTEQEAEAELKLQEHRLWSGSEELAF